jgi:hypothetical protein
MGESYLTIENQGKEAVMANKIILILALAAYTVYYYSSWLRNITFLWWAGILALAIVFNIVLNLIIARKWQAKLGYRLWYFAVILMALLVGGCVIEVVWPGWRLGGGLLFVAAVFSWVLMIVRVFC